MNALKKIVKVYDNIEEKVLVVSLIVTVLLIFGQVVMRYVFNNSLSWSEELARFIFIWQIWLGTSIGFRKKEHLRITIIEDALKSQRAKATFRLFGHVAMVVFCVFLVIAGWEICASQISANYTSPGTNLPYWIVYFALPFSNGVVALRELGAFVTDLLIALGKKEPEVKEETNLAV